MRVLRPIHRDLPQINLVPWRERQRRTRWRRSMQALAAVGAVLAAGMLFLFIQQLAMQADLQALLDEVEQQEVPDVQNHGALLQRAHALYQQQHALTQLRLQLAALSNAMPANISLTEIALDADALILHGRAHHIQAITDLQKRLQAQTQARVVLEQVEAESTTASHSFRIRIPLMAQPSASGAGA